jgi:histidinol-phosphate aminotransferase
VDLTHHGDRDLAPGLVDLAVNVRLDRPPAWLRQRLVDALDGIAAYPNATAARLAVAARHDRRLTEALPTAGAAEAFTLIARAVPVGGRAVVVHPQFTEPEVALTTAGHTVDRVLLDPSDGFRLDASRIPPDASLVVVGNPTNPTSVLHPATELRKLVRPGRIVVVDEAFMDAVPGEPSSLAREDLPGLLVVRSLTKTWGLAGLRAGYVVGDEAVITRLAAVQPPWSVSTPALTAIEACLRADALSEAAAMASEAVEWRNELVRGLTDLGVSVVGPAHGPFVLIRVPDGDRVRQALRAAGWAVRRGDTFPGLGPDWIRLAVRKPDVTGRFLAALATVLGPGPGPRRAASPSMNGGRAALRPEPMTGRVTLVGGGPGDPGLITVRGAERLAEADVVITDRLVPVRVLENLAPGSTVVDAAKIPGTPGPSQDRINRLIVEHALAGRRVVRLKGGDPYVFGRGMEEVEACRAAGVPVEVVPGVSSSVAAPALAGIPVTHRGLTQGFTVVSGHLPPDDPASTVDWAALARSGPTLVLLMAVRTLPAITATLLDAGLPADTPAACVENGGTPRQRVLTGDLAEIADIARDGHLRAPAVTVIGAVAAFAHASTQPAAEPAVRP